jgi:hypothetical protein
MNRLFGCIRSDKVRLFRKIRLLVGLKTDLRIPCQECRGSLQKQADKLEVPDVVELAWDHD